VLDVHRAWLGGELPVEVGVEALDVRDEVTLLLETGVAQAAFELALVGVHERVSLQAVAGPESLLAHVALHLLLCLPAAFLGFLFGYGTF